MLMANRIVNYKGWSHRDSCKQSHLRESEVPWTGLKSTVVTGAGR